MKHSIFLTKIKKGTFSVPSFIEEVVEGIYFEGKTCRIT